MTTRKNNLPCRSSQSDDTSINLLTMILHLAHECPSCGISVIFVVLFAVGSVIMAVSQLISYQLRARKVCGLTRLLPGPSRKGQASSYLPLELCAPRALECWKALLLAHGGEA